MNHWLLSGGLTQSGLNIGPVVEFIIQFSIVLAVGLIGGWLLRRRSPLLRSLVYRITLAGAVIAAIFSFGVNGRVPSRWTVQVADNGGTTFVLGRRTAEGGRRTKDQGRRTADEGRRTVDGGSAADARALVPPVQFLQPDTQSLIPNTQYLRPNTQYLRPNTQYLRPNTQYLLWLWLVGAVGMLGWLFVGWLQIGALRRRSARLTDGAAFELLGALRRDGRLKIPELLISKELGSPVLAGILRPAMILPASYRTEFDSRELRAIFAHELAHLDRGDCAWNLFAAVVKSAAWFHPLVWLLCRELEDAAEDVCDQAALGVSQEGRDYAACLLRLSEGLSGSWPQRSIAAGVHSSSLGRRIRRILLGERDARPVSGWTRVGLLAAAFSIGALSFLLISVSSRPRQTGPRTSADRQTAQTIIRQSIAAEARLKTLTGRITIDSIGGIMAPTRKAPPLETTLVELEKPYSGRISSFGWHRDAVISDGKMMSNWSEDISHQIYYNSVPLRKEWEKFFALGDWWWLPVQAFYGGGMKPLRSFLDLADIHTAGTSVVDGVRCQVVESADPEETRTTTYTVDGPDGYAVTEHAPNPYWHARTLLYFGPDHLLRKSVKIGSGASYSLTLSDIRTNVRLNPSDFKFQPPAGAKPFPITPMHTSLIDGPAPDFILPDSTGGSVSLHGSLKGKKLMLLTMIDHLDLRRRELLALEKTYQTLKADGFTALVVDIDDTADAIKKSLAQAPISYPVLTPRSSAAAKALLASYRAHVFPTSFLVNGRGTIVWSDSTYVTPGTFYIKMQLDHPERWDHSTQRKR